MALKMKYSGVRIDDAPDSGNAEDDLGELDDAASVSTAGVAPS
jgi:hypothetical protein